MKSIILLGSLIVSTSSFASVCSTETDEVTIYSEGVVVGTAPIDRSSYTEYGFSMPQIDAVIDLICMPDNTVFTMFSNSDFTSPLFALSNSEVTEQQLNNVKSVSFRNSIDGVKDWGHGNNYTNMKDLFLYHNPYNNKTELFQAKHDGYYGWFPTTGVSNEDWQLIGVEKVEHSQIIINEARRRAMEARVSTETIAKEVVDSSIYKEFLLSNGHSGGNYGFTLHLELNNIPGKKLVNSLFYEYAVSSGFGAGQSGRPLNFSNYSQDQSQNTDLNFTLISNAANSIGDVIQIVGVLTYDDNSTYQIRTNSITLQR
ncbi:hypothetical protein C0W35_21280 [Photobacterium kishitanii]|uniref:hypothetical protein n=1 Tax=Photobacterium kishitanii TaxID=318456 RepID=UPI00043511AA|nr:hypothetical protein [Photobacterium kishitanii]PSU87660.1 hypothetical protein C0W35_21280 [Photobacterium kishitanii]CEO39140.1 exported hypothetical protein [Photobacterium kishitanii]